MTAAAGPVKARLIPTAVERVRFSYLCGRSQVDVTAPLDVPLVVLLPELVKVAVTATDANTAGDPPGNDGKREVWVLTRFDDETALATDGTLRDAGVTDGEVLRLTSSRALSVPSLYDDAVDAAARLNKAGHPGWDRTAAKWMAFVGVHLASAVWVYFLVADTFAASRGVFVPLSVVAAVALAGAAGLAQRLHGQSDVATALGWAVLPVAVGISWVAVSGWGDYGLACGCAAMILVAAALFRAIGAGAWGYLTAGVVFSLGSVALLLHAAGVRGDVVGVGLATFAALTCRAVRYTTTRSFPIRWRRLPPTSSDAQGEALPTSVKLFGTKQSEPAEVLAAGSSYRRLQSMAVTRSALATGLAVSAGLGASVVLPSAGVRWSGLAFAVAIATALALYGFKTDATGKGAGLTFTAVALGVLACVRAMYGTESTRLTAFITLLATTSVFAVIGAKGRMGGRSERARTLFDYADYLVTAALIPLALWAIGLFGRVEFR